MLLHGYAVEHVGHADGALVMRDDDELRVLNEALEHADEPVDVRFVQGCVQLVQHAERTGLDLVNREEQRHGGHGLFTAGEQSDALQLLAGRAGHDVNAGLQHVVFVREDEVGFAAAEDLDKHVAEVVSDLDEGLHEHLLGLGVDAIDHLGQLALGFHQVVILRAEEGVALLCLLVLVDGHEVDRAHVVEPLLHGVDLFRRHLPVGACAGFSHLLRRERLDLRLALVRVGDGDALAADVVEVDEILVLNALAQVLHAHIFLRQFHIDGAALLLQGSHAGALAAQSFLARGHVGINLTLLGREPRGLGADDLAFVLKTFNLLA